MKLVIKQTTRVLCNAGSIVEVDQSQADFLLSLGLAEEKKEPKKAPAKKTTKKGE